MLEILLIVVILIILYNFALELIPVWLWVLICTLVFGYIALFSPLSGYLNNNLTLTIIMLAIASQVLWLDIFPTYARILFLGCFAVYVAYFSSISGYIRPFFNDMKEWSIDDGNKTYHFMGTGVFINENDVLTNEHVSSRCGDIIYIRTQDNIYSGKVVVQVDRGNDQGIFLGIGRDTDKIGYDFSIISTNARTENFAIVRRFHPNEGNTVLSPDYTNDKGVFNKRFGKISKYDDFIWYSGIGRKGNSGSPMYNENGYLIGVEHSGGGGNPFRLMSNLGTNIYNVVEALQKSKIKYYVEPMNSESRIGNDKFEKGFAVGILC